MKRPDRRIVPAFAFAFAFALTLTLTGCGKPESAPPPNPLAGLPLEERVSSVAKPLVDDGWARGLIVGVIQDGKESYFAFGEMGEGDEPDPEKTVVFEIGSITKVFTAILLADMAQAGEVALDDPVAKYLPKDWNVPDSITLASLAAHTSGLPVIPANFWKKGDKIYDANVGGRRWGEYSERQLDDYFANPAPAIGESGKYVYSNLGAGLLGLALSRAAKKPLSDLIVERVCKSLGMESTSFSLELSGSGHDADGEPVDAWPAGESVLSGAFALRSTCSDMLKFARANLDPGSSPMKEALSLAQQPRSEINAIEKTGLGWKGNKYGVIYTAGVTGGFRCTMYLHPQTKTAVVLMANTQVAGVAGGRATQFDVLGGSLLNVTLNVAPLAIDFPSPAKADSSTFEDYVGHYRPENGDEDPSFPIRVDDGKLITVGPGDMDMRLWPLAEDEFFVRSYNSSLKFRRDEAGKITGADLKFEGQNARLKRSEK
jgi:D-alanyl-D-alanine-carboxypeptidase/D-alanyl-D-alanine-endopeptidase